MESVYVIRTWHTAMHQLDPIHTSAFSFENVYISMRFWPSVHTNTLEYAQLIHREGIDLKTLLKVNINENACVRMCGHWKYGYGKYEESREGYSQICMASEPEMKFLVFLANVAVCLQFHFTLLDTMLTSYPEDK